MTEVRVGGGRFVGERAARARAWEEYKARDGRPFDEFEDEDHLTQAWRDMKSSEEEEKARGLALRQYIHFWATEKRREIERHKRRGCYVRCGTCFLCLACSGGAWRHSCGNGTKMLSPYRLVFLNGSMKRHWMTTIWEVGRGYVPRKLQADKFSLSAHGLDGLV